MKAQKLSLLIFIFTGCGADSASQAPQGSTNVTQGGARDIGLFRQIVERGDVPAPEVLDEVGFFAEHALDLPPATCGHDVCVHPMLAVAPTFDQGNWTMAFVAMNSAVNAANLARPPVHLVLAVEGLPGAETRAGVFEGVRALLDALRPEDRVSILVFDSRTEIIARAEPPSASLLTSLSRALRVEPGFAPGMYEALAASASLLDERADFEGSKRVILLTSGHAGGGISDPARIVGLGEGLAREGVSLGVIVTPAEGEAVPGRELPLALGQIGAGTVAFAESGVDLAQILRQEGETSMFPLATDLEVRITASRGYRIGRTYGAAGAKVAGNVAILRSPAMFLGHRQGASDVGGGRRGGGGGLFVELIAEPGLTREISGGAPAFEMFAQFVEASSGQERAQVRAMNNPLPPGRNPPGNWPYLSDETRGKAFMMLNLYLAFRSAVDFHHTGDCARAKGLIDLVGPMVEIWQASEPDPDIAEDYNLMLKLRTNLDRSCAATPPQVPQRFSGGCFGL